LRWQKRSGGGAVSEQICKNDNICHYTPYYVISGALAMKSMNISLPEPMKDWVDTRVEGGDYASASDYVRDLIRKDREFREKREVLIQALIEGEESGISEPQSLEDFLAEMRSKHAEKIKVRAVKAGQG
jgi:antitoxin ParD1/3/4